MASVPIKEPPEVALDLLSLASQFHTNKICNPLKNFNDGSISHPDANSNIEICQGKDEWNIKMNEISNPPGNISSSIEHISIVSWNILSETWYDESHSQPGLDWNLIRYPKLQEWLISFSNTSIISLQEVDFIIYDNELKPFMKSIGYEGMIQQWSKGPQNQPCAVAIFWKENKFKMIENKTFSRTLAIRLELIDESNRFEFCVINCHLESSQTKEGADKRARQLNSSLLYVSKFNLPIILSGDFNTGSDSMLLHVLRTYSWHINHKLGIVYEHKSAENTLPSSRLTFAIPLCHFRIDHILYSHNQLELINILNPLSNEEIKEYLGFNKLKGFPTTMVPSDHLPIGACFKIKFNQIINKAANEDNDDDVTVDTSSLRFITLTNEWMKWQMEKPVKIKGIPTEAQIIERKNYKLNMKKWMSGLTKSELELLKSSCKKHDA